VACDHGLLPTDAGLHGRSPVACLPFRALRLRSARAEGRRRYGCAAPGPRSRSCSCGWTVRA